MPADPVVDPGRPLVLDDAARVAPWLAAIAPDLSERAFANLLLYRHVHGYRLCERPIPHVAGTTYDGTAIVVPLFDPARASDDDLAALLGDSRWLYPLSERPAAALRSTWHGVFNDDDSDYVYAADAIRTLAGVRERRRQAYQFERGGVTGWRPFEVDAAPHAQALLDAWQAETDKAWSETDYAANREAIASWRELGLTGGIVCHDGMPAAFLLASVVDGDSAIVHFAKGLRRFPGVYPAMFRRFAAENPALATLNFEQDLGNPRFRRAKRAYAPLARPVKWRMRPRTLAIAKRDSSI